MSHKKIGIFLIGSLLNIAFGVAVLFGVLPNWSAIPFEVRLFMSIWNFAAAVFGFYVIRVWIVRCWNWLKEKIKRKRKVIVWDDAGLWFPQKGR